MESKWELSNNEMLFFSIQVMRFDCHATKVINVAEQTRHKQLLYWNPGRPFFHDLVFRKH